MSQRPMEEAYSKFVCNDNKTGWAARDFFDAGWQAALSQSEPVQVSQPVRSLIEPTAYMCELIGNGNDWYLCPQSYEGSVALYSSPPDYEALKENAKLLDDMLSKVIEERNNAEQSMCKLKAENEALKLRVADLEKEIVNHVEDNRILSKWLLDKAVRTLLKSN